jgi:hypothetical protein
MGKLLKVVEAAARLVVSRALAYKWVKQGLLRSVQMPGCVRISFHYRDRVILRAQRATLREVVDSQDDERLRFAGETQESALRVHAFREMPHPNRFRSCHPLALLVLHRLPAFCRSCAFRSAASKQASHMPPVSPPSPCVNRWPHAGHLNSTLVVA